MTRFHLLLCISLFSLSQAQGAELQCGDLIPYTATVGTICTTQTGGRFERLADAWRDLMPGGKIWPDAHSSHVNHAEAIAYCEKHHAILPSMNALGESEFTPLQRRGFREVDGEWDNLWYWTSTLVEGDPTRAHAFWAYQGTYFTEKVTKRYGATGVRCYLEPTR